jgi:hypothetical protein
MHALLFRISLSLLLAGIVVALLPLAYPGTRTDFLIEPSSSVNVVMPVVFRYMELSLQGVNVSSTLMVQKVNPGGSLLLLYQHTYTGPLILTVDPGTYVIQVSTNGLAEPVTLTVTSYGIPIRNLEAGFLTILVGIAYPVLSLRIIGNAARQLKTMLKREPPRQT